MSALLKTCISFSFVYNTSDGVSLLEISIEKNIVVKLDSLKHMLIFGEQGSKLCGLRLGSRDGAQLLPGARAGIMGKLSQTLRELEDDIWTCCHDFQFYHSSNTGSYTGWL